MKNQKSQRNGGVKCPTCNTMSRRNSREERLLHVYINFEDFRISSGGEESSDDDDDDDDDDDEKNSSSEDKEEEEGSSNDQNLQKDITTANTGNNAIMTRRSYNDRDNAIVLLSSSDEEDLDEEVAIIPAAAPNINSSSASSTAKTDRSRITNTTTRSATNETTNPKKKLSNKKLKRRIKVLRKENESLKTKARKYNDLNLNYTDLQESHKATQEEMAELTNQYHVELTQIQRLKRCIDEKTNGLYTAKSQIDRLQDEKSNFQKMQHEMKIQYQRKTHDLKVNSMNEFHEMQRSHKSLQKKYDSLALMLQQTESINKELNATLERCKQALSNEVNQDIQVEMTRMNQYESQHSNSSRHNRKVLKRTIEHTMNDFAEKDRIKANHEKLQQQKRDRKYTIKKSSIHARRMKQAAALGVKSANNWELPQVQISSYNEELSRDSSSDMSNARRLSNMKSIDGSRRRATFVEKNASGGMNSSKSRSSANSRFRQSIHSSSKQEKLPPFNRSDSIGGKRSSKLKDSDIRAVFKRRQNSI